MNRTFRPPTPPFTKEEASVVIYELTSPQYVKDARSWADHYMREARKFQAEQTDWINTFGRSDEIYDKAIKKARWLAKAWWQVAKVHGSARHALGARPLPNPGCMSGTYSVTHANPASPRTRSKHAHLIASGQYEEAARVWKRAMKRKNPTKYAYYVIFGRKGHPQGAARGQGAGFSTPKKAREWAWGQGYSGFYIKRENT